MKQLLISIGVMAIMACVGCSGQSSLFKRTPVVTQAECFPKYLGEDNASITFEWEGSNFSRLEVITVAGDPILILRSPQGNVTTPPITSDMLPLQAIAWWKDESVAVPLELAITDNPTWTQSYASVQENGGEIELKFSRVEQEPASDGKYQTIKIYELFQEFDSFTWKIPEKDFANNVALEKVKNASEYPLIISGHGIKKETIEPNAVFSVPNDTQLTGEWTLKLVEPMKRKVGEQWGESEEGVTITDVHRVAHLHFMIRREETNIAIDNKKTSL